MRIILSFVIFFIVNSSWGNDDEQNASKSIPTGGALLKTPSGDQQLEDQPINFKWQVTKQEATTLTIKIYKLNKQEKVKKRLIGSYDFKTHIDSMKLSDSTLPVGTYSWEIHTFNETNPAPLTSDIVYFNIRAQQSLNLKTNRIYGSFSSGRGQYRSEDPTYLLSFDTTPTVFSAGFAGGTERAIYDISYSFSDFTIRGALEKLQTFKAHYSFRLLGSSPYSFELFVGPQLRTLLVPLITSPDGTAIAKEKSTSVNGGLIVSLHSQMSERASFVASVFFDNAVDAKKYFSNLSYEARIGTLYSLREPIGIGIDLSYQNDEISKDRSGTVTSIQNQYYSLTGKLLYSF